EVAVVVEEAESVRGVELPLTLPRATARPEGLTIVHRVGRVRLRQRLPRLDPLAAAHADRTPRVEVADVEWPQRDTRTGERRVATALDDGHSRRPYGQVPIDAIACGHDACHSRSGSRRLPR